MQPTRALTQLEDGGFLKVVERLLCGRSYHCCATAFLYHHQAKLKDGWMKIIIRKGCDADGAEAINVVRRSISELCVADHEGDAREVADWLSNKTETSWGEWLMRGDATVLVGIKASEIVRVGMVDHYGEVLLNYVRPDARFSGVSKALLEFLESVAVEMGSRECVLESTKTAKKFYESCGCKSTNETGLTLAKPLQRAVADCR